MYILLAASINNRAQYNVVWPNLLRRNLDLKNIVPRPDFVNWETMFLLSTKIFQNRELNHQCQSATMGILTKSINLMYRIYDTLSHPLDLSLISLRAGVIRCYVDRTPQGHDAPSMHL